MRIDRMERLHPLEHLNFALQAVGVLGDNTEVSILQVDFVLSNALNMHKLVLVLALGLVGIGSDAHFTGFVCEVSVNHLPLLVFP